MIAKAIKDKGFRGALEYDLSKKQGRVIDTNMEGADPRELAREFGAIRKLRPNLGRAVRHVSLSAAPGEHLSDDQWREIGQCYLHGMGLDANQYLVTRHLDTKSSCARSSAITRCSRCGYRSTPSAMRR
ncbi:relaxase/mobilization nuclease domain-containing protein [Massilia psychrophila]|uniref:MobA/VirD2-like nuclease domain-containing protein n=1 Tax=Massilia psychrophila TaxID=1603353 RepID=A0A2G8SYU3_9BURK|nr:relaxase/mobilization nuclease domain-containing protein [Massilia psychrophila]PIL38960.1 hypothetical protein CR103_14850 [Massilia psychrophila]GGE88693.1 hypothetical protein GCM10008020_37170 [Massilia psychrophila]